MTQDSRLLYYLIGEIKAYLNINHITVHNKYSCIKTGSDESHFSVLLILLLRGQSHETVSRNHNF